MLILWYFLKHACLHQFRATVPGFSLDLQIYYRAIHYHDVIWISSEHAECAWTFPFIVWAPAGSHAVAWMAIHRLSSAHRRKGLRVHTESIRSWATVWHAFETSFLGIIRNRSFLQFYQDPFSFGWVLTTCQACFVCVFMHVMPPWTTRVPKRPKMSEFHIYVYDPRMRKIFWMRAVLKFALFNLRSIFFKSCLFFGQEKSQITWNGYNFLLTDKMAGFLQNNISDYRSQDPDILKLWWPPWWKFQLWVLFQFLVKPTSWQILRPMNDEKEV